MKRHLDSASIPIDKMTSFASDGPAVMVGKKNGVIAHLKRDNDSVIHLHCLNHRLQLAVSKVKNYSSCLRNQLLSVLFWKKESIIDCKCCSFCAEHCICESCVDVTSIQNMHVWKQLLRKPLKKSFCAAFYIQLGTVHWISSLVLQILDLWTL